MIKLLDLLTEQTNQPKALFLAGPAGAGKSTFIKEYLSSFDFEIINVDDSYEALLKKAGLSGRSAKSWSDEENQKAGAFMGQARKDTAAKFDAALKNLNNIIIDSPGAASNPIKKKKDALEELGFKTFMVIVYVSPLVSLERNTKRDRQLFPAIIMDYWTKVVNNIPTYRSMFGQDIVVVDNDPADADKTYDEEKIAKYYEGQIAKSKETDPVKLAKKKKKKEEEVALAKKLIQNPPKFDSSQTTQSKLNAFIS